MSTEPRYENPSTSYHQHNNHAPNNPAYNSSIPDHLDGDSASQRSQPLHNRLDPTLIQKGQNPYLNPNEVPPPPGMYNQNSLPQHRIPDFHGGGGQKGLVGNNLMMTSGGGDGKDTRLRDVMGNQVAGRNNSPIQHQPSYPAAAHSQHSSYTGNAESSGDYDNPSSVLRERGREMLRRSSQMPRASNPNPSSSYNYQQAMSDHFDHYKRPPSRDRDTSRDRSSRPRSVTRAQTPEISQEPYSRAQSRQRTPYAEQRMSPASSHNPIRSSNMNLEMMHHMEGGPMRRAETPSRHPTDPAGHDGGGKYSDTASASCPLDDVILRQQGLGQEIPHSVYTPKRTESLFLRTVVPPTPTPLNTTLHPKVFFPFELR